MSARTFTTTTVVQFLLGSCGAILLGTVPAAAQGPAVRAGVSIDPDQVFIGGHYETAELVDRVHFRPGVDAGLGDDVTHIGLNFEFAYKFPKRHGWGLYAGAGPAINIYSHDSNGRGNGDSSTDAGLNVFVGVEQYSGLFFEFKIGAIDSPNLKFAVGWSFR